MVKRIEAIYEGGVLRPVERLDLTERQRVELTLRVIPGSAASHNGTEGWPEMESAPAARSAALDDLFADIERTDLRLTHPLPTRNELHGRG